jgi:hypothetical protein
MRDRFPLLVAAALALGVATVWLFAEAGKRGTFAEPLSTYRSAPDGARGLFLLAQKLGLPVSRRHMDLRDLDAAKTGAVVVLGVERMPQPEIEQLQKYVSAGGRLLIVERPEEKKKSLFTELLHERRPLLDAFGVTLSECDTPEVERDLEVAVASPLMRGVEQPQARVAGYLTRREGDPMLPLVVDPHAEGKPVAISFWRGDGRIVAISAPDLATNRGLARGDNARMWASILVSLAQSGPIEFDEFHHGFTGERSISGYAARHGLHWAVLQLLLALWVWVAAQRRFGRARQEDAEERVAGADYLWAMARIYRSGGHRAHAVRVLFDGLTRALARKVGLPHKTSVGEVVRALNRRGRPDLGRALSSAEAKAVGAAGSDREVLAFARSCAGARKLSDRKVEDSARRWFQLRKVRAALGLSRGGAPDRSTR